MTQFHEGQDVEVRTPIEDAVDWKWRKAKIVGPISDRSIMVEFPDNTRAVFDAAHIRAVQPYDDSAFDSAEYDRQARR